MARRKKKRVSFQLIPISVATVCLVLLVLIFRDYITATIGKFMAHGAHPSPVITAGSPDLLPPPNHKANIGNFFQVVCPTNQRLEDDPIVYPGVPGVSHQHQFFGNSIVNANSTFNQLVGANTSCEDRGDSAAYWVPTLYDSRGRLVTPRKIRAYYYGHAADRNTLQAFPPNLRIIAGDRDATTPQPKGVVEWFCRNRANQAAELPLTREDPPTCRTDQYLSLSLRFPDCLAKQSNGQPMTDSDDHRRHMAYADARGNCPASHPIKVPKIRISEVYDVNTFNGGDFTLGGTRGGAKTLPRFGMHGDFWNTWNQSALTEYVNSCLKNGRDVRRGCN